jgi:hypothetical protein
MPSGSLMAWDATREGQGVCVIGIFNKVGQVYLINEGRIGTIYAITEVVPDLMSVLK